MNWTKHRKQVQLWLESGRTTEEIARELNVTEYVLKQFLHRNKLFTFNDDNRNLALEVIKIRFIYPEYFKPTRSFFEAVGIKQRRWWQLYRGEKKMLESEYKKLALHLQISLQEAFEARQINWVTDLDNKKL